MATRKTSTLKTLTQAAADDYAFAVAAEIGAVIDDSEVSIDRRMIAYTTEDGETFEVFMSVDGALEHRWS